MVWAGISSNRRVGPFFFEGRVTGNSYLEMLQEKMMPVISEWEEFNNLIFQQDGAPSHYALSVREYLNNEFSTFTRQSRITLSNAERKNDLQNTPRRKLLK